MNLYDVKAPAKLNLFLRIIGKRTDGYHLIQSIFVLIDWQDNLHFELIKNSSEISRQDLNNNLKKNEIPTEDLCVKAAKILQKLGKINQGVKITLDKQIPTQAGLGGGSSDAASTLIALNKLWNLNLNQTELSKIALTLGADVPFFIHGKNAFVEGIGEKITSLKNFPKTEFLVIKPNFGLSTKEIFANLKSENFSSEINFKEIEKFNQNFEFKNDLQNIAENLCPELKKIKSLKKTGNSDFIISGSGSAMFSKIDKNFNLENFKNENLLSKDWKIKVCRSLEGHLLFEKLLKESKI